MKNNDPTESELSHKLLSAVSEVVKGTDWAPPEGGILVDCLVVLIHVDDRGEFGSSWLSAGSAEQAEGMARKVLRSMDQSDIVTAILGANGSD